MPPDIFAQHRDHTIRRRPRGGVCRAGHGIDRLLVVQMRERFFQRRFIDEHTFADHCRRTQHLCDILRAADAATAATEQVSTLQQ